MLGAGDAIGVGLPLRGAEEAGNGNLEPGEYVITVQRIVGREDFGALLGDDQDQSLLRMYQPDESSAMGEVILRRLQHGFQTVIRRLDLDRQVRHARRWPTSHKDVVPCGKRHIGDAVVGRIIQGTKARFDQDIANGMLSEIVKDGGIDH